MNLLTMSRTLISIFIITLLSCSTDQEKGMDRDVASSEYILVVDLSDRLSLSSLQSERDKIAILDVLSVFTDNVKNSYVENGKDYSLLKDKFKFIIQPKEGATVDYQKYERKLSFDLEGSDENTIKYLLSRKFEDFYIQTLNDLYNELGNSNDSLAAHANLWDFFNSKLGDEVTQKKGINNYLFLLSDGYVSASDVEENETGKKANRYRNFDFKEELERQKEWKTKFANDDFGLVSTGKKYPDLSVMLIESEPELKEEEQLEFLEMVWRKWLSEMEIQNFEISNDEKVLKDQIYDFLKMPKVDPETILAVEQESDELMMTSNDLPHFQKQNEQEQPETYNTAQSNQIIQASNKENAYVVEAPATETTNNDPVKANSAPTPSTPVTVKAKPETTTAVQTENQQTVEDNMASNGKNATPSNATKESEKQAVAENYNSISLGDDLNKISTRKVDAKLKEKTIHRVIGSCLNSDITVKLVSNNNIVVDRYYVRDYLSRIKLLGKYEIEVIEIEKNSSNYITEIIVKESRIE